MSSRNKNAKDRTEIKDSGGKLLKRSSVSASVEEMVAGRGELGCFTSTDNVSTECANVDCEQVCERWGVNTSSSRPATSIPGWRVWVHYGGAVASDLIYG